MASPTIQRSILLTTVTLLLVAMTASCTNFQTIMIPRYASGSTRATDPFGGDIYRLDREVDGRHYALLAVSVSDSLFLAAEVGAGFVGDVRWYVGECQLDFALGSEPDGSPIPIKVTGDLGKGTPPVGQKTSTAETTIVQCELPRRTLVKGDGAIILEIAPRGSSPVTLPASGRLRGVYLMQ